MMIESIKHFLNLLLDNQKSWTFRAAAGISIIGFLILTDLMLSFTYNLHINNKINQIEKIQKIKKEYECDSVKLNKIIIIENKILNKEHYTEFVNRNLSNILFKAERNTRLENESIEETVKTSNPVQSLFWMAFSANFILALFLPFLLLLPLYNSESRTGNGILGWFASLIMVVAIGTVVTWIAYQIPIIWNNAVWNYILNFIIHMVFGYLVYKFSKSK